MSATPAEVDGGPGPAHGRPPAYPAEKARQGEIILKTKWARMIVFASLFGGFVVLAILAIALAMIP